jgi:hypothetical protein
MAGTYVSKDLLARQLTVGARTCLRSGAAIGMHDVLPDPIKNGRSNSPEASRSPPVANVAYMAGKPVNRVKHDSPAPAITRRRAAPCCQDMTVICTQADQIGHLFS